MSAVPAGAIIRLTRRFRFGATTLEDIDPNLSPEQVLEAYTPSYPFLRTASIGDPIIEADTLVYPIDKPQVQTKGAGSTASVRRAIRTIQEWGDRAVEHETTAQGQWGKVYDLAAQVLARPPTPHADAMTVPML